jgi:hypothetical protein
MVCVVGELRAIDGDKIRKVWSLYTKYRAWKEHKHPSYLHIVMSRSAFNFPISVEMVPESKLPPVVIRITKNWTIWRWMTTVLLVD